MKKPLRRAGFVSLTLGAIGCGEPASPDAIVPQELFKTGTADADSLKGESWRKYLDAKELHRAWAPPAASPWRPYYKPTLIAAIATVQSAARPIHSAGTTSQEAVADRCAGALNLAESAVFVDLPGEESVVWGAALQARGLVPVVTINNWPHQFGILPLERPLGALLYYGEQVSRTPAPEGAGPVFILDRARLGQRGLNPPSSKFDNRFYHVHTDFPSADVFKRAKISRVYYVNPRGITSGCEEDDLSEYFVDLAAQGIQFTFVRPMSAEYELAIVQPSKRDTIFTKHEMANYVSSPQYHSHYYRHYHSYSYWHSNYWSRSYGAWGGSGSSGYGSSGGSSGFSS